jgi:hypothetical protein
VDYAAVSSRNAQTRQWPYRELLEFGLEHESTRIKTLLENASVSQVDADYTEILMRLIEYYNGKRKTTSEYQFKKNYDVKAFCY